MNLYELKSWSNRFESIVKGETPWDLLINDRNYNFGDIINYKEYDVDKFEYTGRTRLCAVVHVMNSTSGVTGLLSGYCILTLVPIGKIIRDTIASESGVPVKAITKPVIIRALKNGLEFMGDTTSEQSKYLTDLLIKEIENEKN